MAGAFSYSAFSNAAFYVSTPIAPSPHVYITVGGVARGWGRTDPSARVLVESLSITDILDEVPNTCRFTAVGFVPTVGQPVVIAFASLDNPDKLFAGTIRAVRLRPLTSNIAAHNAYDVDCIDPTWGLNRLKVTARYTATSATAIATALVANWASGYTTYHVQLNLPVVDEITFTNQPLTDCLTQLARRVGAYWFCDYAKEIHLFLDAAAANDPEPLTPAHPSLSTLDVTNDISQIVTRALGEGGGSTALTHVGVGDTVLPIADVAWFAASGGRVTAGPQRIRYSGVTVGGTGALVGPGAAPSAAPTVAAAPGSGVNSGAHDYAVTFVTASGESIPGPRATVTVGNTSPPATALTPGTPTAGSGPDPGAHSYGVTFVTAAGETTVSPLASVTTSTTSAPVTAPSSSAPTVGNGPDPGIHDYAVTFVTATGETTAGPTHQVTTSLAGPAAAPTLVQGVSNEAGGVLIGSFRYIVAFRAAGGETELVNPSADITCNSPGQKVRFTDIAIGPAGTTSRVLYRLDLALGGGYKTVVVLNDNTTHGYVDNIPNASLGAAPPTQVSGGTLKVCVVPLQSIPTGGSSVTARKVYRTPTGGGTLKLVTTISNNTVTTYSDTVPDASLGANAPTANTAVLCVVPLSNIPLGPSGVTGRKIYRTAANASQLKLFTTLADNTTTATTDTLPDSFLGANAPTVNTATANQVAVTNIQTGVATVTARKVYRTEANASQLKLLATIGDNTTTTYTDATPDASLGANAPTADTSGLVQPAGQVVAGSTSLIVASTGPFLATGGFAVIGNGEQVIRYSGKTATALTGIPASGPSAITASISYNSTVTQAPQLTGIPASGDGSIRITIPEGNDVNVWVIIDDVAAQAALASLIGGDGVQEDFLQDRRLSEREMVDRLTALLALRSSVASELTYTVRGDLKTRAGTTIAVALPSPWNVNGDFKIQQVIIGGFADNPDLVYPTYTVTASSTRFSFEDLLRRIGATTI